MSHEFMTSAELAEYMGISRVKVGYDRARGKGPPFLRMAGHSIRYRRTDVDQWIKEHTVTPEGSK